MWHTGRVAHRLLLVGIGAIVLASLLMAATAWRLSVRPVSSAWLTDQVRAALADNTGPVKVGFDSVALSWDGFRSGVDYPLDLRIAGLDVADRQGQRILAADEARLHFGFTDLLRGRLFPRAVEILRAQAKISRQTVDQLSAGAPPDQPSGKFEIPPHLQNLQLRDSSIQFDDPAVSLKADGVDLNVMRGRGGRMTGTLRSDVTVGGETAAVQAKLDLLPDGDTTLTAHTAPLRLSALGLQAADIPVELNASAVLDAGFHPQRLQLQAQLGSGRLLIGKGSVPLLGGSAALSATPERLSISHLRLDLMRATDGLPESVSLAGTIDRGSGRLNASLNLGAEHIDAADLTLLWPEGVGGGARHWITEHVLGGLATQGAVSLALDADKDLHNVVLTRAEGDLDISNAAFTWIDNVPPIEQAEVHLHLVDPDTLDLAVTGGRQRVAARTGDLLVKQGQMRITGLSTRDQATQIQVDTEGPVLSVLSLLSEPRLHLLSVHPLGIKPAAGEASASLSFRFPLMDKLDVDDVDLHVAGRLAKLRIPAIVGRNALDDGALDIEVDKDGLALKGRGALADIPVSLAGTLDFRAGPPDQTVEKIDIAGEAQATQLTNAGLPVDDVLSGPIPIKAEMTQKRNGDGTVALNGDLSAATLTVSPLAWRKQPDTAANLSGVVRLSRDKLEAIDRIVLRGDGLLATGSASFTDNRLRLVALDQVRLGRTQARGTVRIDPSGAVAVALQGPQIDLAQKLTETAHDGAEPSVTPQWTLDGRFGQALLAHDEVARNVLVKASGAGEKIRTVDATGATSDGARFSIAIVPEGARRHLSIRSADAGRFLRGLDAIGMLQAGTLEINGTLDGPLGFSPLAGTAQLEQVVVKNSPVLGKLLQAITLYGLVDALRGPGMLFNQIAVPFRYDGHDLHLENAVARNASLGLTAEGRIGMGSAPSLINGTIVPAYFFNALPGQLPLVGKLFSPEKGGGVFAARFSLTGPIADPTITVNAASALTPGFLRNMFGIFDRNSQRR